MPPPPPPPPMINPAAVVATSYDDKKREPPTNRKKKDKEKEKEKEEKLSPAVVLHLNEGVPDLDKAPVYNKYSLKKKKKKTACECLKQKNIFRCICSNDKDK